MKLRIVLVEDDPLQAEWMAEEIIWKEFPEAEIKYYDSEYSFLQAEAIIEEWKPTHALLDLMVRYYSINDFASENKAVGAVPPKPEEAGYRCQNKLKEIAPNCLSVVATVLDVVNANRLQKGSPDFGSKVVDFLRR